MFDKFAERSLEWVGEKGLEIINGGVIALCKLLASQSSAFVIVAIIGAYIVMLGYKDTGNKIMSTSVIVYLIVKVVSVAC